MIVASAVCYFVDLSMLLLWWIIWYFVLRVCAFRLFAWVGLNGWFAVRYVGFVCLNCERV